MMLDIVLPSALFLIAVTTVFLYTLYEKKVDSLFGEKEFNVWHVVLLVIAMGALVTFMVFIPGEAIRTLFLLAYSATFFLLTYLIIPKWYLAAPTPVLFIALYFSPYWNIYTFNLFAIMFAIGISIYMGSLFTWKTTAAFVALLTIVDVIQVLITRLMITSSEKALSLGLPVAIILPSFPFGGWTLLGLGDIFMFGLLSIQTTKKYGKKFGFASILLISLVFLLLQSILLSYNVQSFPATVLVISGWLTSLGARYLYKLNASRSAKTSNVNDSYNDVGL
jgi:presenilin-like A22 family membrane protease